MIGNERQFIAIDAGGTKTDVVWFTESGKVISRVKGKAANPNGLPPDRVKNNLQDIFRKLLAHHTDYSQIKNIFAGFAGGSHPKEQHHIKALLEEILPFKTYIKVNHDAVNALWSGTHGKPGLVLIAGTGSIVYGITEEQDSFRVGGWGYLVGDEGSGFDIGRQAVVSVLKAHDGRGKETYLTQLIMTHFDVHTVPDLIPIVYQGGKSILSSLVPLVVEAIKEEDDQVALNIIDQSAKQLADLVHAGINKFKKSPQQLVFVGGLHHLGELILTPLKKYLGNHEFDIILPTEPPVYGAAIECLLMEGIEPTQYFTEQFKKTMPIN